MGGRSAGAGINGHGHAVGTIATKLGRVGAGRASKGNELPVKYRKKLIEVALPLDAINAASAREKSIRHGHPSTLHLWWARRPLAAARAVIFSQMVDDPAEYTDVLLSDPNNKRKAKTELKKRLKVWETIAADGEHATPKPTLEEAAADQERDRLFKIIEALVKWENTTNETVLQAARDEIWQSWRRTCADNADHPRAKELFDRNKLPAFHDPFAGGGALPLEAQRLGLEAYASDLNPVAVLINKAMIEIPPKFAGQPPVNPDIRAKKDLVDREWKGAQGLAEDVRYYGQWMRDEAEKRIGHLYPKIEITEDMVNERPDLEKYAGKQLTVIAWLWARTVKSPNPAFAQVDVPLASTFKLSTKAGKEAYVEPVIEDGGYRFTVKVGTPKDAEAAKKGTKLSRANFTCLMSGTPVSGDYIKAEGKAGRMGARLMAIVAEGNRGRVYLAPTPEHEAAALKAKPTWRPEGDIATRMTGGNCTPYGLTTWGDLFTPRQLVALTTFSDLVQEARERVQRDALAAGLPADPKPLHDGGTGATAYAEAVGVYLSLAVSRLSDRSSTICSWDSHKSAEKIRNTFGRQALPMTWDYADGNCLTESSGGFTVQIAYIAKAIDSTPQAGLGSATQDDASTQVVSRRRLVSTDPPYYDNIGYADLSDFFYVWLRRSLRPVFPDLFATLAVPKAEELVATPYRHGSKEKAESFFLDGMTQAMHRLAEQGHSAFPLTIYYAFKQSETESAEGTSSTGWETFLDAVILAGFAVSGTWPMRTELSNRMIGSGTNALASSIILVCRPRATDAATATRREFVTALKAELPVALAHLQRGNIAPVDLAQAAIGPGMAVYTRYAKVLDAEGKPLSVREALALINQTLDEALAEQEGDFDADSRWALTWFEQSGFDEGEYGMAEQLSKSKNTSVSGMVDAGIVESKRGKVRLLRPEELPADWDPVTDPRLTAWEVVHHLIRVLASGGEGAAAELVAKLGAKAEIARELAYRLYTLCDRPQKKRAAEALAYNGLVQVWPAIQKQAQAIEQPAAAEQAALFEDES
jgi:putative DNA methylase